MKNEKKKKEKKRIGDLPWFVARNEMGLTRQREKDELEGEREA